MKITRRKLAVSAFASGIALAQTPAPVTPQTLPANDEEEFKAAKDQTRRNSETLAQTRIPMSTEPAFQFKA